MSPEKLRAVIALIAYLNRNKHDTSLKLPRQIAGTSTGVETINVEGTFENLDLSSIKVDGYNLIGKLEGSSFDVKVSSERLRISTSGTQLHEVEDSHNNCYQNFSVDSSSVRFADNEGNSYICQVY